MLLLDEATSALDADSDASMKGVGTVFGLWEKTQSPRCCCWMRLRVHRAGVNSVGGYVWGVGNSIKRKVLLLDEATSALDADSKASVNGVGEGYEQY